MAEQSQNQFLPIRFEPKGGLNSDFSPLAINGGDYRDASGIHFLTQLGSTTVCIEPCLGNSFSFQLPTVDKQNKIFRIYIEYISPYDQVELEFFDGNGVSLGVSFYTPVTNLAATYAAAVSSIQTTLGAGNISIGALVYTEDNFRTVSASPTNYGYFSFQFTGGTSVNYWNYSVDQLMYNDLPLPIITQEAIDASLAGALRFIGSYNINNESLIWSTNQTELPEVLDIISFADNGSGLIRVTVADTTKVLDDASVTIKGSNSSNNANGTWIVDLISATTFDLLGSVYTANDADRGTVMVNVLGIGEIGVAVHNINDQSWSYTTLIRSREFNFRTKKQPKIVCERQSISLNCYWTDNYNPYRRFYYRGDYMTNGGLNFVDILNEYFYGSIYNATRLFQNNTIATLKYYNQLQSGGTLYSGNYRYVVRFMDEFFNPTVWSDPSGIYVTYPHTNLPTDTPAVAQNVYGDASTAITPKINQILVEDIVPNLFKYVELGALFYVDNTPVPVATIVSRTLLNQTTSQILSHTGNETDVQSLDINTLLQKPADIFTGLGIDIVSNRLLPSNTTSYVAVDFQDWIDSIDWELGRAAIPAIVDDYQGKPQNVGEYELAVNTFNYPSFMINETYRISAKLELLNGSFTDNFHLDDVAFTLGNGLPSTDLTSPDASLVYLYYLKVLNINWDFEIDGQPVRNTVKRIHWEMVEMTEQFREILGSGFVSLAIGDPGGVVGGTPLFNGSSGGACRSNVEAAFDTKAGTTALTDYVFMEGAWTNVDTLDYPSATGGNLSTQLYRDYFSFYAPDILLGQSSISFLSGDKLIAYAAPSNIWNTKSVSSSSNFPMIDGAFMEVSGYSNDTSVEYDVLDGTIISKGTSGLVNSVLYYKRYYVECTQIVIPVRSGQGIIDLPTSLVCHTNAAVNPGAIGTDFGFYPAQYYRPKVNKFGAIAQSEYVPTGAITDYLSVDTIMYGDVFTQKTWLRHRIPVSFVSPIPGSGEQPIRNECDNIDMTKVGFGGGVAFYSQNRANSQMIFRGFQTNVDWQYPAPFVTLTDWLVNFYSVSEPTMIYNSGYNYQQGVTSDIAYDPDLPRAARTPARFWWSLNKPESSIADLYTVILPLNFKDEDLTDGDIWHTIIANGSFYTLQQSAAVRQYIEDTSLVTSTEAQVVMGSSGVATQRGNKFSGYGTIHGFGVIKGKSKGGKDTFYWIDTFTCKVNRHAESDGTVCLSDAHNMRWFFNNFLQFTNEALTPADNMGICGVWDDQNSEAIWTVRARKSVDEYMYGHNYGLYDEVFMTNPVTLTYSGKTGTFATGVAVTFGVNGNGRVGVDRTLSPLYVTIYNYNILPKVGDVVTDGAESFTVTGVGIPITNNGLQGDIFISKIANNLDNMPFDNLDKWELVPHFGRDVLVNGQYPYNYYNEYTIAYNEVKDKFVTRYPYLPKIYIKTNKWFTTPDPVIDQNFAFTHYTKDSEIGVWYPSHLSQIVEAFIEGMTINYDPNLDKRALAIEVQSEIAPYQMSFETKKYSTSLVQSDFTARGDFFVSNIKNNEVNGVNSGDTSKIFGSYISVKMVFRPLVKTYFYNFILKCVTKFRVWKS